jgi:hypothetical protein
MIGVSDEPISGMTLRNSLIDTVFTKLIFDMFTSPLGLVWFIELR